MMWKKGNIAAEPPANLPGLSRRVGWRRRRSRRRKKNEARGPSCSSLLPNDKKTTILSNFSCFFFSFLSPLIELELGQEAITFVITPRRFNYLITLRFTVCVRQNKRGERERGRPTVQLRGARKHLPCSYYCHPASR